MNMIEKVARALIANPPAERYEERDGKTVIVRDFEAAARAAIEAMREPTPVMRRAGDLPGWDDNVSQGLSGDIWTAMIDAALKEE